MRVGVRFNPEPHPHSHYDLGMAVCVGEENACRGHRISRSRKGLAVEPFPAGQAQYTHDGVPMAFMRIMPWNDFDASPVAMMTV